MELFGPKRDRIGSGIRFCSDMMISGHTFVTCLYALGLLELTQRLMASRVIPKVHGTMVYRAVLVFVLAEQFTEIALVTVSHFHYSADILAAIMITLLWYTNGPVVIYSRWWAYSFGESARMKSEGTIWIPPCCIPLCDWQSGGCWTPGNGYHELKYVNDDTVMEGEILSQFFGESVTWKLREHSKRGIIINVDVGDLNEENKQAIETKQKDEIPYTAPSPPSPAKMLDARARRQIPKGWYHILILSVDDNLRTDNKAVQRQNSEQNGNATWKENTSFTLEERDEAKQAKDWGQAVQMIQHWKTSQDRVKRETFDRLEARLLYAQSP